MGINVKRMMNLVKVVRNAPKETFSMHTFVHSGCSARPAWTCGTPACALGHYAASNCQKEFKIVPANPKDRYSNPYITAKSNGGEEFCAAAAHFGISDEETVELFDSSGCGGAGNNPKAAANYIEKFLARKIREELKATK